MDTEREGENDTTQPPSELLHGHCFSWLCLVGHIPSICTGQTLGSHFRLTTEDTLLPVH